MLIAHVNRMHKCKPAQLPPKERVMTHSNKNMVTALTVSTVFIIFNIIAVTQSTEKDYYSQIEHFIINLLP